MTSSRLGDFDFTMANERAAPPVEVQQRMEADSWRVIRAPSGQAHLVILKNLSAGRGTVYMSSPISKVDGKGCVVTTSSGRQYLLTRPPEHREFERDVIHCVAVKLGMGNAVDVSVYAWDLLRFDSTELRLR
ncbi:MAG: hypothetical protein EON58_01825 [Alphaproteobacteria bacterium]|nr:MAG: hypothetical protein EON58_01825 [Alphaproteobacteria bacterium]